MKTGFKVGDRVRLVGERTVSFPTQAEIGMVGTVIEPEVGTFGRSYSVAIDLDGIPRNHGMFGEGWWFGPDSLELVKED